MAGSPANLSLKAYVGHSFQLQRTSDLVAASWENVDAAFEGDGTIHVFTDATPPTGIDRFFYRVVLDL